MGRLGKRILLCCVLLICAALAVGVLVYIRPVSMVLEPDTAYFEITENEVPGLASGLVICTEETGDGAFTFPGTEKTVIEDPAFTARMCEILSGCTFRRDLFPAGEWPGGSMPAEEILRVSIWQRQENGSFHHLGILTLITGHDNISRFTAYSRFGSFAYTGRYRLIDEPGVKRAVLEALDSLS